jgi:hypothetical protein
VPDEAKSAELCKQVTDYLIPRRLLGTVLNVFTAVYTPITLTVQVVYYSYATSGAVKVAVKDTLCNYFDPVKGGPLGNGWPYGRDIYIYELCNVVEKVPGVKMVLEIVSGDSSFPIRIEGLVDNRTVNSPFNVIVKGEHEEAGT